MRDFVYIIDAVDMTLFFIDRKDKNGIYNVGSGKARTWNDLVSALFKSMGKPLNIEYINLPKHLKDKYQYFTEARLEKIKNAGYNKTVTFLEKGINEYVDYLQGENFLGY
jgi:ADP-L-glycero-D-manno-heptose 6-epimerase